MANLQSMSDDERANYLRSLPLDELLELAKAKKRRGFKDGELAWKHLDRFHCHICHKPISDEESIRLGIGSSDCRPMIERKEGRGAEMWTDISQQELEALWTKYNVYENRRKTVATRAPLRRL
jgi:hypothetical protein